MDLEEIKRGLRGEIKKRENEQYCTCETNIRQMCKDVLAKLEEQESVIAELKKACNDKDGWCRHTLKENRHHKYKQCLAMVKLCQWKMGVFIYKEEKSNFYHRWHKRWLAIAEKFKEAK